MVSANKINVYIPKNNNLFIGIILVFIIFALIIYLKPELFIFLFNTILGNCLLGAGIVLLGMFDIKWAIGLAALLVILYQAVHINKKEGMKSLCPTGCAPPTGPYGGCTEVSNGRQLSCPWGCSGSGQCSYDSDCANCSPRTVFNNPITPSTACTSSKFGCCSDGTTKIDNEGSNCPGYNAGISNACSASEYGCCADWTTKIDQVGSNCPDYDAANAAANMDKGTGSGSGSGSGLGVINSPSVPSSSSERNAVYTVTTWPQQTITDFINFQKVHNPNFTFDINILQRQATAAEVQSLIENNVWPWSDDVKQMYKDAMANNWNVSVDLGSSLNTAQSIYNQTAIMELLAWNTKEGEFLIDGAVIGQSKNMPSNVNNIVRCASSGSAGSGPGSNILEKVVYTGYNSISGNLQSQVTPVSNSDIPSVVNGFQFLGSGACNPCSALDYPPNYSCPFSINTGNGATVSPVWQKLWGLDGSGGSSGPAPVQATATQSLSETHFPLLTQLTNELSDAAAPLLESVLASMKNKGSGSGGGSGGGGSVRATGVTTNPPSSIDRASSSNPAVTNGSSSGENYRPTNMGSMG